MRQSPRIFDLSLLKQKLANQGFEIINDTYRGLSSHYLVRCPLHHHRTLAGNALISGKMRCPECINGQKLKCLREKAAEKGITLLSTKFVKLVTKYDWMCKEGHFYKSYARHYECQKCAASNQLNLYRQKASERNIKLLSTEYLGSHNNHLWECEDGHRWEASIHNVIDVESNCPHCRVWFTETKCRFIIEQMTGFSFTKNQKILPQRLELDGYCEELKIAFEYNGEYHYTKLKHITSKQFNKTVERDKSKLKFCGEKSIKLIVIPYFESENLEDFIRSSLIIAGIESIRPVNWDFFNPRPSKMKQLIELLKRRKIQCLTTIYPRTRDRIDLKCDECGCAWSTLLAGVIYAESGCPKCNKTLMLTIDEVKSFCKTRDVEFLSESYTGRRNKYLFRCPEGHVWSTSFMSIRDGGNCNICAGNKKLTNADIHNICNQLNLIFMDEEFNGRNYKHKFKCNKCSSIRHCQYKQIIRQKACPNCPKSNYVSCK